MPPLDDVIEVASFRSGLRRFLSRSERIAARHGLTQQRYLLLLMIKGAPDGSQRSTVSGLSARLHLAPHTVTELVTRAEHAALVRRETSSSDRRVAHISLTAKGERVLAAAFRELQGDREVLRALIVADGRRKANLDRSTIKKEIRGRQTSPG